MEIERVRSILSVESEWDDLVDRVSASPWMRPGWVTRWLDAFGSKPHEIVCCRDHGRLRGVFPIMASTRTVAGASNSESPATGMVVEDQEVAEALATDVLGRGFHRLDFLYLTKDAADTVAFQRVAGRFGYRLGARTVARSPYLATTGGWDEFLARRGTKPFREERRKHRMLQREGKLTFETLDGSRDLDLMFNHALAIERSGWKGRAGTAIADETDVLRFYRSIVHWAHDRGTLRLNLLRLDGQAIAFDLVLLEDRVVYLLKTSYDESLYRFSPGRVLRWLAIQDACDGDVDRYEFLGTDDDYKRKWADDYRERLLIRGFAGTTLGHLEHSTYHQAQHVRRTYLGPLKRRLLNQRLARKVLTRR